MLESVKTASDTNPTTSGLGHIALQVARGLGFRVVALSSSESKRELAHQLGAYEYIDGSKVDQAAALKKLGGAKVIMATAPNAKVIEGLLPGLAVDGTLLLLALEDTPITISPSKSTKRIPFPDQLS